MNIKDIAALAGVSKAAVSRYLNNGYLSEEKREKIRKVIEETGYRPLAQAQTLRSRRNKTIGVILPKIESYSVSSVVDGILPVLNKNGYQLLLSTTENSPKKELDYLELFDDQRVEGVILLGSVITSKHTAFFQRLSIPLVVIGQQIPGLSCVYHDDYQAIYDITNLVLRKGCRRLVFMRALPQDKAVGQERYRGYCDAVRSAGYPELVNRVTVADFTIAAGRDATQVLWEQYSDMDALICTTDRMALGALQFFHANNIQVPEQLLLTGQGGMELCEVTTPTLTTVRFAYKESGSAAAELLLERLRDDTAPNKELKLGYKIVERQSTQRP